MKSKTLVTRFCLTIALAFLLATTTFSQSTTGSITGTVKDTANAAVPGATVTATNPATGDAQIATSNDDGVFVFAQLPPATYTIAVERAGFKRVEKTNVVLIAADRLNAGDFMLDVGAVAETVTVQADAGQLQVKSESGERSEAITNKQIKDLALNGRNILDLMKVVPGVVSTVNGQVSNVQGLGDFNVNGTRSGQQELTIDGASNVNTGNNAWVHVTVNPDAIAEVKVLTSNFQAEYGKAGGGFIQIVTKSGTSEFHGTGRYFRRHDSLNANNFFSNARGLPRPLYRYNYYGYDIGGPVIIPWTNFNRNRDKLFFFFNQEFYDQLVPNSPRTIRTPTQAERNGDFSQTRDGNGRIVPIRDPLTNQPFPGNIIPRERFFRDGQAILNIYPMPNDAAGGNVYNYSSQISQEYPRREDILRIDYNISDRTRLTGRVINNEDEQIGPYGVPSFTYNFPLTRLNFPRPGINGAFTLTHTFNPTTTNEFIFGPSHDSISRVAVDDEATRRFRNLTFPLLFPEVNTGDYIPNFGYGGGFNQTFPQTGLNGLPSLNTNYTFNFINNLTKVAGQHTIKAGIFIQHNRKDQTNIIATSGTIDFASTQDNPLNTGHPYANALLGIYNTYQQPNASPPGFYRYTNTEFYVQDTWRMHPRLTLDYGLRVSFIPPQYDERDQLHVFNPEFFDRSKAVRLYEPILVGSATRAVDPSNRPATPTAANTLPGAFIGLIVPNSGSLINGIVGPENGYPRGGFDNRGAHFGPRAGFAYDLTGDGNTVLRGGFGISYDRLQGNIAINQITNPPTIVTPRLFYGNLGELSSTSGVLAPPNIIGYAKDGKVPTVYSYSVGVQRNVGFGIAADVAYVGTLSRHLSQARNLNAIPYGTTFTRAAQDPTRFTGGIVPEVSEPNLPAVYRQAGLNFTGQFAKRVDFLRPYIGYGDISYREFVGSSNYHSLQVAVNRRFSRGLTFGLAYTLSKAMDTANGDTESTNPFNTRAYDYRLASFDRTHVFVVNYVYDLPKLGRRLGDNFLTRAVFDNWQISGISQHYSGTPFELGFSIAGINAGQRITGSYTEGPRFNLRGDPSRGPNGLLINPDAFVIPTVGSIGPYSRSYLRNPSFTNHDISIFKNFPLSGESGRYLQFRLEMFNAFNTTQFSGINSGTNLAIANPTGGFTTGGAIFNNYGQAGITNNLRPEGSTAQLGQFFGEYNNARDPRIIQLGVKVYF